MIIQLVCFIMWNSSCPHIDSRQERCGFWVIWHTFESKYRSTCLTLLLRHSSSFAAAASFIAAVGKKRQYICSNQDTWKKWSGAGIVIHLRLVTLYWVDGSLAPVWFCWRHIRTCTKYSCVPAGQLLCSGSLISLSGRLTENSKSRRFNITF